jgi:hypothetical protein
VIHVSRAARVLWQAHLFIRLITPVIALACLSCGKVGAPVAPLRFSERTSELTAVQRGNRILLTWPAPSLVQDQASRSYIARAEVYRLTERRDEEPVLDIDDYEEMAEAVGILDRAEIEAQIKSYGRLQFSDVIDLSQPGQLANTRVRYAVRYFNKRGQSAAFSNTVALEPAPAIAQPPSGLSLAAQAQDAITISWSAPAANVDGSAPASVVGYNVYRRTARQASLRGPVNSEPLAEPRFVDRDFQYKLDYVYVVRALSQGSDGLIESADSEPLAFTPIDTFAPAAPDPVSIASANGVISLFWPNNSERDVVGYNIYRSDAAEAADKDWSKLNKQPHEPVTYRDESVTLDRKYFYRVTAIDRFNNESKPSRVVSETAYP